MGSCAYGSADGRGCVVSSRGKEVGEGRGCRRGCEIRVECAREDMAKGELEVVESVDVKACDGHGRAETVSWVEGNGKMARVWRGERGGGFTEEQGAISSLATKEQVGCDSVGVPILIFTSLLTVGKARRFPHRHRSEEVCRDVGEVTVGAVNR